ncbi:MAG: acyl-ACP--UDP-N-acetylglucosamine O-acyltransferase [Leptonema sp. (in: Bacteria)]|nr:acyl-ACP--UDP-N-acetylglucosamine O-acyltransferase [Leptonema sp. (in: bacteria)]
MSEIHSTAIVHPNSKIGNGVKIGAYTIIEDDVEIGEGTIIANHCTIHSGVRLGKNNEIFAGSHFGADPQDLGFDRSIRTYTIIGDNNTFRENTNIHRGSLADRPTKIGNNNYLMGGVHIAHDCVVHDRNIFTHNSMIAGHVHVGNHAFISGFVGVHQFAQIGDYVMIGGLSKITKDIIPYSMADGNPSSITGLNMVGLKRAGFTEQQRRNIKNIYKILFMRQLSIPKAVEALKNEEQTPEIINMIKFIESSKRGILTNRE